VRSPIEGIIVQGDWITQVGMPLKAGDGLFEVCEPKKYLAQVELSMHDLDVIKPGCPVTLCTGSFLDQVHGSISRIEPKSRVKDDRCFFLADVELQSTTDDLQPGLIIDAKLKPEWKSAAWQLFRHPSKWLANFWIW
jgi:hypothetical protein